jgi:hypothetical protein
VDSRLDRGRSGPSRLGGISPEPRADEAGLVVALLLLDQPIAYPADRPARPEAGRDVPDDQARIPERLRQSRAIPGFRLASTLQADVPLGAWSPGHVEPRGPADSPGARRWVAFLLVISFLVGLPIVTRYSAMDTGTA